MLLMPWLKRIRFRIVHALNVRRHIVVSVLSAVRIYIWVRYLRFRFRGKAPASEFVAIALTEHLGDIVASEPIARRVRRQYPEACLFWCVRTPYKELLEYHPSINYPIAVHCLSEWHYLATWNPFDRIVDLHFAGRTCPICKTAPPPFQGNPQVQPDNYFHLGNLLTVFCTNGYLDSFQDASHVYIPRHVVAAVEALKLPDVFLTIHCASFQPAKDWLPVRWQALVENIWRDLKVAVVEVGLEATIECPSSMKNGARYFDTCGKLSILETAEVIKRASLFIGVESGPAHLANAVGTSGIVLLGQYAGFDRYFPYNGLYAEGKRARFVNSPGAVAEIKVETVYNTVKDIWPTFLENTKDSI